MLVGMIQMLELHVISMFYVKNADKSCILVRKDMDVTEQEILSKAWRIPSPKSLTR